MSKKKQTKPVDIDLSKLAGDAGLTLLRDSDYAEVQDRLPLFLPRIDRIFGGGLPFGRMVEIAGKPGGGKCLVKETHILTNEGYKTVEEIINEEGLEAVSTTKVVPAEISLVNRHGQEEKTSHIHFNGKRKVYKVKTRTGLEQRVTGNHPLLVISKHGTHIWKEARNIKEGDYLVTRVGDGVFGNKHLDKDTAYALGALVADGHFGESYISFTNNDTYILDIVKGYLEEEFDTKVKVYDKEGSPGSINLRINDTKKLEGFYSKFNINPGVAKDKHIPDVIMRANEGTQISFLRGYMDCESSIDDNRKIEVTSASKKLLTQVQLMLKNMGILSFLKDKVVKGYEQNYYGRLTLYGLDALNYAHYIGYGSPTRIEIEKGLIDNLMESLEGEASTNHDYVPHSSLLMDDFYKSVDPRDRKAEHYNKIRPNRNKHVSRNSMDSLLNNLEGDPFLQQQLMYINDRSFYYDQITEVYEDGEEPTFDFTLPKTHSFVAESIINHNSTISFHVARVATALGCIVLLVDVEGTADRERLSHLGIDPAKILVKQPDEKKGIKLTVEEVGRTIEEAMGVFHDNYPGVPVVIIWDSVGQTPSEEEMEKDFGDRNVGSRAKAITQLVYKIAPIISETKSLFIGINQVRDDIGGNPMFPTYSVPGGNAWEHYASLRLEIQQKQQIKKGTERIGHTLGVHLRKSKVSRPFQIANGFLISDNGIDYEYNLAEMAKEDGILKAPGQSFEYVDKNGEIHKKKRENFIEWLRTEEGQPVRQEILNKLIELEFPEGYTALKNQNLAIDGWIDQVTVGREATAENPETKEEK